ncbi:MAG: hypothetical protein ABSG89_02535 [Bacteroidales bacterium]|jgi:hypothetical protein
MAISNAKHIIGEIDGVRCTIVDSGVTMERAAFLRGLLEFNNLEVMESKITSDPPGQEPRYTIGVTDLVFNPAFAVYERILKTPEGGFLSPGYWKQECTDCDSRYWMRRKTA